MWLTKKKPELSHKISLSHSESIFPITSNYEQSIEDEPENKNTILDMILSMTRKVETSEKSVKTFTLEELLTQ